MIIDTCKVMLIAFETSNLFRNRLRNDEHSKAWSRVVLQIFSLVLRPQVRTVQQQSRSFGLQISYRTFSPKYMLKIPIAMGLGFVIVSLGSFSYLAEIITYLPKLLGIHCVSNKTVKRENSDVTHRGIKRSPTTAPDFLIFTRNRINPSYRNFNNSANNGSIS